MSTVEKYFKHNHPGISLITTDDQIKLISKYLNEFFGKYWNKKFDEQYVRESKEDRILILNENNFPIIHIKIVDRDIGDLKCLALSALFKTVEEPITNYLKKSIDLIINYTKEDVDLILGTSNKKLLKYYIDNFGVKESGVYYEGHDTYLFYKEINGFVANENHIDMLKKVEVF